MSPERDLSRLLASLDPVLDPQTYVFATLPNGSPPEALAPIMLFQEAEGLTVITTREAAEGHGLDYTFPCRRITLQIHSALDAVGLIAHVADSLAKAEIPTNPVSAYFHDHLFVPELHAGRAMEILVEMSDRHKQSSTPD
jgi:hypothetical protein